MQVEHPGTLQVLHIPSPPKMYWLAGQLHFPLTSYAIGSIQILHIFVWTEDEQDLHPEIRHSEQVLSSWLGW